VRTAAGEVRCWGNLANGYALRRAPERLQARRRCAERLICARKDDSVDCIVFEKRGGIEASS
jgi:hypothetical protein